MSHFSQAFKRLALLNEGSRIVAAPSGPVVPGVVILRAIFLVTSPTLSVMTVHSPHTTIELGCPTLRLQLQLTTACGAQFGSSSYQGLVLLAQCQYQTRQFEALVASECHGILARNAWLGGWGAFSGNGFVIILNE